MVATQWRLNYKRGMGAISAGAAPRQKFGSVQVLRAIAANIVVLSHLSIIETKYSGGFNILPVSIFGPGGLGRLGVDLFFMISGFIMATLYQEQKAPLTFLWNRITRIYPIYWFYTALVLAVAAVAPGAVNSSYDQSPSILKSLALWPDRAQPWLGVGWSLIHEMYFYIVIAVLMFFRLNLALGLICWAAIVALSPPSLIPETAIIFSPLTYEFIAGAFIFIVLRRFEGFPLPAMPLLERLGDASYSTYLSHVLLLSAMGRVFALLPWHGWFVEVGFLVACMLAANAWGVFSFYTLERPVMEVARSWSRPRQQVI
jgi:peptidoglycan/LPS O-acetylase OafA/YrhL